MFFLSVRVLICPRFLFNCFICASILLIHHGSILVLFLFLTPNISVTTTAPVYTKSFSYVIFTTSVLFITSSTFLVFSNNLCFSIPLSGGNLSLVSFDSTLHLFKYSHVLFCNLHIHLYYRNIAYFLLNIRHHAIFQHNFTFFHKHILSFMIKSKNHPSSLLLSNLTSPYPISSILLCISPSSKSESHFLFKIYSSDQPIFTLLH